MPGLGLDTFFIVSTDSSGNIINWVMQVFNPRTDSGVFTSPGTDAGFTEFDGGQVKGNPGIWRKTPITTVTPELPTSVLMSTALLAMAFWGRKRIVQAL
jgi:hypothetical protein